MASAKLRNELKKENLRVSSSPGICKVRLLSSFFSNRLLVLSYQLGCLLVMQAQVGMAIRRLLRGVQDDAD